MEADIKAAAAVKLKEFGIELLDVRLRRVNYNPDVLGRIYQRMISERLQIAQRFRSEGEGEAARIAGQKERDLNEIQSTAYRQVQEIRGRRMREPPKFMRGPTPKIRRRPNSTAFSRAWRRIEKC